MSDPTASTVTTGDIASRLGFNLPGNFIEAVLKVPPSRREKAAKFWTEAEFTGICTALNEHVANVRRQDHPPTVKTAKPVKPAKVTPATATTADDPFADSAPVSDDPFAESTAPADADPFGDTTDDDPFK